ncbi:DoxX family membrane protein [Neobacillus drentensis]|uniref:DoxX family membrane protein n=1 Tax=Neobacillus drentensis TaxID=220684 RepID=UPI0028582E7F|nr:DoxX family membrane protein [Neobacillus drentensis]MDR7238831.1 thiosulfate dehydrogenase [quinone] large subunit [Neobacillus drentensis]
MSTLIKKVVLQLLVTIMRILFGVGWLLAGVTKITEKHWFSEPGVFIENYLLTAVEKPNVSEFYKYFIEHVALDHVLFFNYTIPIVQIIVGICLIVGFIIVPSVFICLFMHVNFILSGNMNLISLTLYTSAFAIIFFIHRSYVFSLDRYFGIDQKLSSKNKKVEESAIPNRLLKNIS